MPWGRAIAFDPYFQLGITQLDPGSRDASNLSGEDKWRIVRFLGFFTGWNLERMGVSAGEKVNFQVEPLVSARIGSVHLELTGALAASRTDNSAPYSLYEDVAGMALPAGTYQISATVYSEPDRGGTPGTTVSAAFTLVADTTAPSVSVRCGKQTSISDPTSSLAQLLGSNVSVSDTYFNKIPVEIGISEPPVGFDGSQIEITHGTGGMFVGLILSQSDFLGSQSWHFSVHYVDNATGEATVRVPAGAFTDETGNANTASERLHIAQNRTVSAADTSAMEGANATMDFEVTLDAANDCETATVDWATADGTAMAGQDYTAANGSLTFAPGETTKTVSVVVLDDEVEDSGETFTVQLSNVSGVTLANATATGTIHNDDTGSEADLPSVTIQADASYVREGSDAVFTLSRTGDASVALTVSVTVSESGAMLAGEPPAAVTFEAGASTAALGVATEDDEAVEEPSAVTAALAAGDGYALAADAGSATVTAEDDDDAPVVTTASPIVAPENGTAVATLAATDEDTVAESLAWSLAGGVDADEFTLTEGGVLAFEAAKDYEAPDDADTDGAYAVTVRVSDGVNVAEAALTVTLSDVDEVAPSLTAAAVNGPALTLSFGEALDDASVPAAAAFTVEVDGTARGVDTVDVSGSTVTLTLASAVASGEVVTAGYAVPAGPDTAPLRDAAGNAVAGFSGQAVTNETPARANAEPTGAPTIGGTARVGEVLAASVEDVEDADGLEDVTFAWQWLSNDGTADTPIEGATEETYTVAVADIGKTLTVRVTFTDERGTEETLESAPTTAVEPEPLTLSVADAQVREEPGATLDFVIALSRAAERQITVYYMAFDGSAKAGADYTAAKGSVVFSPGDVEKTVSVAVLDDGLVEDSETMNFWLSGVRGLLVQQITDPYGVGTILSHTALPPEAPRKLSLAAPEGREGELVVSWEAPESEGGSAVSGYKVQWKSGSEDYDESVSSARQAVTDAASLNHTITGLGNGVEHTLRVMATNAAGDGAAAEATGTPLDRVAPSLAGAAVNGTALTLTFGEALDEGSAPAADAFTVEVDGTARGVDTVDVSGSTVTLTLASAVASGEVVTAGYAVPAGPDTASLRDAAGNAVAGFSGQAVTNETPTPANAEPTGVPVIGGVAGVGETLAASVTEIADADGLGGVTFGYQWLSNDGTADTPIEGATEETYTVAVADVGKTLKVRVTFTDERGTEESLTSAPTAAVAGPFTASVAKFPESHDGSGVFTFELHFSEEFTISYRTLRDVALRATDGTVLRSRRLNRPSNKVWEVHVRPETQGTVTVVLAGNRPCEETGAVCANDGRRLSGGVEVSVPGPDSVNAAPTGLPTIGGTARVGETLRALSDGIADADGLNGATFAWQWLISDGTSDTAIEGATEATYTIAATDVGRTLAVRVTFTDDGGTEETLTSAPTAAVTPAPAGVSIAAVSSPVTEGADAVFTLSRTGDASVALTVSVTVSESGAMLAGEPPAAVTFEAGASTAALGVATEDDEAVEEPSAVTAALAAGDGYALAADAGSATVTAEDDDDAPVVTTASPIVAPENGTAVATLAATDEDTVAESLAWSLAGGVDADEFTLTEGGVLAFEAAKDYEAPDDADTDGAYAVTVRVSDGVNVAEAALTVTLSDVDEVAPSLTAAAVNGPALTLSFGEALDDASVPAAAAFTVEVDGTARGVDTVDVSGSTVTLTLASAVASGEVVTAGYAVPAGPDTAPLRDAAGNAVAGFSGQAVTNETPARANAEPTGAPTIGGTARVGEVLAASVEDVEDADGLEDVTFAWQWLSNDGTADTPIEGATEETYTVAVADIGKTLTVRVTFTDERGTEETLTSAATAAVAAARVEVSIAAASSPVTEGADAVFTLTRTGNAEAALTVPVSVSQAGSVLDGAAPAAVTFAAGSSTASLVVATEDDDAAEADARVTAGVAAGDGYNIASGAGTAGIDVLDDDQSAAQVTVLWSADMAVVDYETGAIGAASADLFSNQGGTAGLKAKWLWYYAPERKLRVAFTTGIPEAEGLTLHLGDVAIAFPEESGGDSGFTRSEIDLDWTDGETVAARLTSVATSAQAGPGLSAADAQIREAAGASLVFRVTLDSVQDEAVSVRYATADGTATAGADYVSANGALRFEPGVTEKTVAVQVLEDAHDEGSETLSLTLSDPFGTRLADGQATGTIVNTDPLPKAWLARFGRTVAGHVVEAVGARFAGNAGGSHVTIGGQQLSLGTHGDIGTDAAETVGQWPLPSDGALFGDEDPWLRQGGNGTQSMTGRELLLGSSFVLNFGADEQGSSGAGTAWTAWGQASSSRFDGREGELTLDGDVTTLMLGVDAEWSRTIAGVALALSEGDGGFTMGGQCESSRCQGKLESTLTSVHPYARLEVSERLSLWGILGYGRGDLTYTDESGVRAETDTTFTMGAAGARSVLVPAPETGGMELAVRTDATLTRSTSEAAQNLEAAEADTSRLRLLLEGSRAFETGEGGVLTPSLEAGLRLDGGDAETGTGVEVGAGVRYTDAGSGLSMEARVRGLVAHEDAGYDEWGMSGSIRIDPDAGGRGLSFTLTPAWGAASGDAERLWSVRDTAALPANNNFDPAGRLDAEVGYGFGGPSGLGVVTPYAGLALAEQNSRSWRAGARWQLAPSFGLDLEGNLREQMQDGARPAHGLMLRGSLRW